MCCEPHTLVFIEPKLVAWLLERQYRSELTARLADKRRASVVVGFIYNASALKIIPQPPHHQISMQSNNPWRSYCHLNMSNLDVARQGFDQKWIFTIFWFPKTYKCTSLPNFNKVWRCFVELLTIQRIPHSVFRWDNLVSPFSQRWWSCTTPNVDTTSIIGASRVSFSFQCILPFLNAGRKSTPNSGLFNF